MCVFVCVCGFVEVEEKDLYKGDGEELKMDEVCGSASEGFLIWCLCPIIKCSLEEPN